MRARGSALLIAVTMAALALFGVGGFIGARGYGQGQGLGDSGSAAFHAGRHDDATTVTAPRQGAGGVLLHNGRKSPRSASLRSLDAMALLVGVACLKPPQLLGSVSPPGAAPPAIRAPFTLRLARAPPV